MVLSLSYSSIGVSDGSNETPLARLEQRIGTEIVKESSLLARVHNHMQNILGELKTKITGDIE